jgi:hypothetical protein
MRRPPSRRPPRGTGANPKSAVHGVGVVPAQEQQLPAGLVTGIGGDVAAVEGVERLDDAGAGQQGGDVLAAGQLTQVGDLRVRRRGGELVGGVDDDAAA